MTKPTIALVYATRQGQTRRIAAHLAGYIREHGIPAEILDAAHLPAGFSLADYDAAVLLASVRLGRHHPEMTKFVKRRLADLEHIPSAFLSVSLSEAGAENLSAPAERRAQAAADANRMIQTFLAETGWRPELIKPVAGALLYTKYNFVLRFAMRRIARQAGGAIDTSKDKEYTDWAALEAFAGEFTRSLEEPSLPSPCLVH